MEPGDAAGRRKQPAATRATTPHHERFARIGPYYKEMREEER
jgi:hypothetical protein